MTAQSQRRPGPKQATKPFSRSSRCPNGDPLLPSPPGHRGRMNLVPLSLTSVRTARTSWVSRGLSWCHRAPGPGPGPKAGSWYSLIPRDAAASLTSGPPHIPPDCGTWAIAGPERGRSCALPCGAAGGTGPKPMQGVQLEWLAGQCSRSCVELRRSSCTGSAGGWRRVRITCPRTVMSGRGLARSTLPVVAYLGEPEVRDIGGAGEGRGTPRTAGGRGCLLLAG